jgi:hypothetical protein
MFRPLVLVGADLGVAASVSELARSASLVLAARRPDGVRSAKTSSKSTAHKLERDARTTRS